VSCPQVIYSAKQSALASSNGWCYAHGCSAAGQSGSGNNWALGHNKFGPAMAPAVLELVRKQVSPALLSVRLCMHTVLAGSCVATLATLLVCC
jgi:hypothetical protein